MKKSDRASSLLDEATKEMNAGKFSRAFTLLKDLLATDPTHHQGRRLLATLLLKFGNLVTAKNAFDSLLKDAFKHQDYETAESLLKEYLAVGPRCIPFIEMMGEVYERKADPIAAVIEYEKAIKILLEDPDNDGTFHARELYTKVKTLAPNSFVLERLAPKFEVSTPNPVDGMSAAQSRIPRFPDSSLPETMQPPITILVSDSIETPTARSEGSAVLSDSPISSISSASPDASPASIVKSNAPASADEKPIVSSPLRFIEKDDVTTPQLDPGGTSEQPVSPPSRLASTIPTPISQPVPTNVPEEGVPSTVQMAPAYEAAIAQPNPLNVPEPVDKVPFPPVNQMPPSALVEEKRVRGSDPEDESSTQPEDAADMRPFWEKESESGTSVAFKESEDLPPTPTSAATGGVEPSSRLSVTDQVSSHRTDVAPERATPPKEPDQEVSPEPRHPVHESVQEAIQEPVFTQTVSRSDQSAPVETIHGGTSADRTEADRHPAASPRSRPARRSRPSFMRRARTRVSILIRRGVSAAGSVTRLALFLVMGCAAMAVGSVALTLVLWLILEEKPSERYQDMIKISPPRQLENPQVNGYLLLLGFETNPQVDPIQAGYDRWLSPGTMIDESCTDPRSGEEKRLSLATMFQSADPATQFKSEGGGISGWIASESVFLNRYRQWLGTSSDDWGYGYLGSPDCAHILKVHRLFVAEGFMQDVNKGLDRLETDLTAWRAMLAQAKTLSMKSMSAEAVKDDVLVISGLLNRPVLEHKVTQRVMRLAQPLDADERSLRWPMQNEFMLEVKRAEGRLRAHPESDSLFEIAVKKMPVPTQRTLNAYAKYYDALIKTPLTPGSVPPKLYDFARTPVRSHADPFLNPLDNALRTEAVPNWDGSIGMILETDTRLRLAGLQSRLRGLPAEQQILAKVAQAGPAYFDPFTELPMLLNVAQGRLYSVGRDGKDDGGDLTFDISVPVMRKGS